MLAQPLGSLLVLWHIMPGQIVFDQTSTQLDWFCPLFGHYHKLWTKRSGDPKHIPINTEVMVHYLKHGLKIGFSQKLEKNQQNLQY